MRKTICFDMDGTIADLYNFPNWLKKLRNYDATPYQMAKPMWDMERLHQALETLRGQGWEVTIITWLSKDCENFMYDREVRRAKREWCKKWGITYDHFHGVKYGTKKSSCLRKHYEQAILFDDNHAVRETWTIGDTVDPTAVDIIEYLENLIIV